MIRSVAFVWAGEVCRVEVKRQIRLTTSCTELRLPMPNTSGLKSLFKFVCAKSGRQSAVVAVALLNTEPFFAVILVFYFDMPLHGVFGIMDALDGVRTLKCKGQINFRMGNGIKYPNALHSCEELLQLYTS